MPRKSAAPPPGRTKGSPREREKVDEAVERFGKNLKAFRNAAKMSQPELARRAGIHRTEVSKLERGKREPRLNTMFKLAASLGVTLDQLAAGITYTPPPPPPPLPPPLAGHFESS